MKVDYIALSIPVFFILIGIELLISFIRKRRLYRFNDSITNISLGIGQQVVGIFMKTALFFFYLFLFENYRLWNLKVNLVNWLVLFFSVDFFYYWFHRFSHEVNAMWAAHIVHHQSEEYNLSVALRQSWFQNAISWVFYLPLAFVGFEPVMFLTVSSFNTLYQFWIHTRTIGKMGFLELFLNTPSHHRVHHGSNPKYLDKNHAGILIIWDRLFGTFQEEEEEPTYGITKPLKSWNPMWANFHYWDELIHLAKQCRKWSDKLLVFVKSPGWKPAYLGGKENPTNSDFIAPEKYDANPSQNYWHSYVFSQFIICLGISTLLLFNYQKISLIQLLLSSSLSLMTLVSCGAILENKTWIKQFEFIRTLEFLICIASFYGRSEFIYLALIGIGLSLISFISFLLLHARSQR